MYLYLVDVPVVLLPVLEEEKDGAGEEEEGEADEDHLLGLDRGAGGHRDWRERGQRRGRLYSLQLPLLLARVVGRRIRQSALSLFLLLLALSQLKGRHCCAAVSSPAHSNQRQQCPFLSSFPRHLFFTTFVQPFLLLFLLNV